MLRKYCSWDSEGKRTRWVGIDSLVLVSNYRTDESSEVFGRSQAIISNTIVLVLGLLVSTYRFTFLLLRLSFFFTDSDSKLEKNFPNQEFPCPYIYVLIVFFLVFFSSLIFFIDRHSRLTAWVEGGPRRDKSMIFTPYQ